MLPRLYFLFLTNFFLSSFFNFKSLCLFQYYFIKKLFVCVLFFLAALLLYIIWQRERKSVVRSVPSIFFLFVVLFHAVTVQNCIYCIQRRQERLLFFSDIVFRHAKFLVLFSSPYNLRYCVTFYFLISTFSFSYKPS